MSLLYYNIFVIIRSSGKSGKAHREGNLSTSHYFFVVLAPSKCNWFTIVKTIRKHLN